jgi:YHS domain-containing protein
MAKPVRLVLCLAAAAAVVMLACSSQALPPVNTTADGLAIKGYDPVAYFTRGEPTKGSEEFEYEWNGAKWRFATREHLEMFKEDPERYAPQYGGY